MSKPDLLDAVEKLEFVLRKIKDFDKVEIDLSKNILDNRIITLEGYLRYLDSEGIPKMKQITGPLKKEVKR